jgi:hypothetical protein
LPLRRTDLTRNTFSHCYIRFVTFIASVSRRIRDLPTPALAPFRHLILRIPLVNRLLVDSRGKISESDRRVFDHERPFVRSRSSLQPALFNFGLRSASQLRCAGVRPLDEATDRRFGRGDRPSAPENLIGAAVAFLRVREVIPRVPTASRWLSPSPIESLWALSELDREMRREQREKWRIEINAEILP